MSNNYKIKLPLWKGKKWGRQKTKKIPTKTSIKKKSLKFLQSQTFFNTLRKPVKSSYMWANQWSNSHSIHKSVQTFHVIQKFFVNNVLYLNKLNNGFYLNKFYVLYNHNTLKILCSCLEIFPGRKAQKKTSKNKKKGKKPLSSVSIYIKKIKDKKPLKNLAKFLLQDNKVKHVELCFYKISLPRHIIHEETIKIFKKQKNEMFFWQSLQLIYGVFNGYVSSSILAGLIYKHTRRNPRRLAFITYIKRLCDWHFQSLSRSEIQGVRLEIKGRFNAKSRAKKQIISTGRVRIHEKSINVDYARIDAFTKFGCLGIKVWLCPKNKKPHKVNPPHKIK